MDKILASTPRTTNGRLLAALRDACPGAQPPVYLEVRSRPDAVPGHCYSAVERHLEENTGERVLGWVVWEASGAFLCMEHHAVARCGGGLVDVARHVGGERRILFAPDPSSGGEAGRNRFAPLSSSPYIARLVALKRRNDDLERRVGLPVAIGLPEWRSNHWQAGRLLGWFCRRAGGREERRRKRKERKRRGRR